MHDGAVHLVEDLVEDALARQQRADRHMAAGQRLRDQHHVGLDVPVLDREETAGAAHAGLDLVGDEQRAVFLAERGRARQEFVGGHVDALALDRLDDEGGDLARRQRLFERGEIVEGDRGAARQQRLEAGRGNSTSSVSDSAP